MSVGVVPLASVALLLLAACSGDPVKDLGGGAHSVTACSDAGVTNPQVGAWHAADRYCGRSGQVAAIERFEPGTCGRPPTSAITAEFTCR